MKKKKNLCSQIRISNKYLREKFIFLQQTSKLKNKYSCSNRMTDEKREKDSENL